MKPILTLLHPDTVSGTTTMDDGTKVYWTEGCSDVVIVKPDGPVSCIDAHDPALPPEVRDIPVDEPTRNMTTAEEGEYDTTRRHYC